MPPKSAKRTAAVNRSSPRTKAVAPGALQAVPEERAGDVAAEIVTESGVMGASPATAALSSPLPLAPEGKAGDTVGGIVSDAGVMEGAQSAVENDDAPVAAAATPADDEVGRDSAVVEIKEETMAVEAVDMKVKEPLEYPVDTAEHQSAPEARGERNGEDGGENELKKSSNAVDIGSTPESSEGQGAVGAKNKMEVNESAPEVSGEVKTDDDESQMESEQGEEEELEEEEDVDDEELEEEEETEGVTEEEEESEEEGDKQIFEDGAGEGEADGTSGDEEEIEEDEPAIYMQAPPTERTKQKGFEVFIGGLDKGATEEDLIKVFEVFGEIQSVRIVKHPITKKSKGFAFIRYAAIEHAKKALAELKDGAEVNNKKVQVSAGQDNDTLYVGNICKTWNRDKVLETLKSYGVEQILDIFLPNDANNNEMVKGFAFLEFNSHSDAMAAFQRLRKPDAVFGHNVSAKVCFAQAPLHPCEEDLLKVKTVYIEGLPKSWDKDKIKQLCKQFGEIKKIHVSRNSASTKRKDFGFIDFSSRDSAVACVEGISNTQFGVDINVIAKLAKPVYKGRLVKQSRGGFKVQKNEKTAEGAGKSKKKEAKPKAGTNSRNHPNLKNSNKHISSKSRENSQKAKNSSSNKHVSSKFHENSQKEKNSSQTVQSAKGKKRGRKNIESATSQQQFKRARKNHSHGKGWGRRLAGYSDSSCSYSSNPYTPHHAVYATPATNYSGYAYPATSGYRQPDLEPHAGYFPASRPVRIPYEFEGRRDHGYALQPRSDYGYIAGAAPSTARSSYVGYSSHLGYQDGYAYQSSRAYAYRRPYY